VVPKNLCLSSSFTGYPTQIVGTNFAAYFTGLIEGDGCIVVPDKDQSESGRLSYPSVQIAFHLKDFPLAQLIQKTLGSGSLNRKKGKNAYIFTVNNFDGLFLIISLLNGNMRSPKVEGL
jgi:hypothetical protein